MNKNWLYRILAIALVAMLALPMFAMAEEAAAFELGADGEATAAEQKLIGGNYEDLEDSFTIDADAEDINIIPLNAAYGNSTYTLNVNMATDWLDYQVTTNGVGKLTCTKNTKKSVLTCDKHNHITIKKTGKATLTFKTTSPIDGKTTLTITLKVNVKDTSSLKLKKEKDGEPGDDVGKVWNIALGAPFTTKTFDASDPASSAEIGESSVLALCAAFKEDGDADTLAADFYANDPDAPAAGSEVTVDECPITRAEAPTPEFGLIALYKSSNKSVAKVHPFTGEIDAKKVGTTTVTCTLYHVNANNDAYPMKSVKTKIKVTKNKSAVNSYMKLALAAAKDDEAIYFGVKQAEYTKIKKNDDGSIKSAKLKVTFFVANGTDNPVKSIWEPHATLSHILFATASQNSFGAYLNDFEDADKATILVDDGEIASGKKSVNWKPGKISTFTHTFDVEQVVDLTDSKGTLAVTEFTYKRSKNDNDKEVWKIGE